MLGALRHVRRRLGPLAGPAVAGAVLPAVVFVSGCARAGASGAGGRVPGRIQAVGAENEYASVIGQIGGRYVHVTAIESNPNTDPHSFEASPSIAQQVSAADLVVQNGLGYDDYMNQIEAATPTAARHVIIVQRLLGLGGGTPNPHLWYAPRTMPALARALVSALSALQPAHRAYFQANARRFDASLRPWLAAIARFRRSHAATPVAVTEPVADYLLQAMGTSIRTPFALQADIMNGVDVAPQDVSLEDALLGRPRRHGRGAGHVRLFLYNRQVTDTLTQSFLQRAAAGGVPVVGVYETMPAGYDYQSWMLAETDAIDRAVQSGASTRTLER